MNRTDINPAPAAVEHKDMANVIRALSMDAVQAANSGHPGMPMGMADVATVLFRRFLKFDPAWPQWPDRDRFVLSAGHGSMLLYSLLYLSGYKGVGIGDLKKFRRLHAKCAGHPEYDPGLGIETTTGPLGQGIANGVGMALAERMSAARYGSEMVDHQTYVIAGDGCLMEGISHEAISFAGHMKLGKLMVLFDDNQISIDGPTDLSVSDDQIARFTASGWYCQSVDGHDPLAIANAIGRAKQSDQPSMIACRTIIGYGAPNKQGTSSTHGAPLGADEIAATREALGWPHGPFEVPDTVLDAWRRTGTRSVDAVEGWRESYQAMPEDMRAEFDRTISGDLPAGFDDAINGLKSRLAADGPAVATRKASQLALETINALVPETIGGSADLTGSVNTKTSDTPVIAPGDFSGRFIHYGVREHAMGAIMNGIAVHKGFIPYSGTFMVFSDYARPAIRLSALMRQRVIYVMTHDSIGLGEDGPTHQPVEHLASLRAMPNLLVLRPADTVETAECWAIALKSRNTPSVISLTRQGVPALRRAHTDDNLCARGGYEISAAEGDAQVTLISTGSEVGIAIEAQALLADGGIAARVVSMPCTELFDDQDADYRAEVLGPGTLRVAIEAGATYGWDRYVGETGAIIGMTSFGASAPAKDLYKHFGITADAVVAAVRERI